MVDAVESGDVGEESVYGTGTGGGDFHETSDIENGDTCRNLRFGFVHFAEIDSQSAD
jgi:hypothetical protein